MLLTLLLHLESVARLYKHVGGILVLLLLAAEEAEAAAGALQGLLGLWTDGRRSVMCSQPWRGRGKMDLLEEGARILSHGGGGRGVIYRVCSDMQSSVPGDGAKEEGCRDCCARVRGFDVVSDGSLAAA